jgi:hypothetical protein
MASQLINDGFFPAHIKLPGHATTRLKLLMGTHSKQLAGLSVTELSERSDVIEAEIDELAKILRVFLVGLVLLSLAITLATL